MLGGGDRDFPPPCPDFDFSEYRMLAPHWSLAATAHQKSGIRKCFGVVEGAGVNIGMVHRQTRSAALRFWGPSCNDPELRMISIIKH
jgi:hypothetical protein